MPDAKLEKDIHMIEEKWNSFILLLKKTLQELVKMQTQLAVEIKRSERLERIFKQLKDVDFILEHKEELIRFDKSLSTKFEVLEAFKKRSNLENPVAVRVFNEITSSEGVKRALNNASQLRVNKENNASEMQVLREMIRGTSFDKDTIIKYSTEYGLEEKDIIAILFYPIVKSARKTKKNEVIKEETSKNPEISKEEIEANKELFARYLEKYESLNTSNRELLDAWYQKFLDLTEAEKKWYVAYTIMTMKQLEESKFIDQDNEVLSKIYVMRIMNSKSIVEEWIKKIRNNNSSSRLDIEFLALCIEEYSQNLNRLAILDSNLIEENKEKNIEDIDSFFFFLDDSKQPIISENIHNKGYQSNLINLFNKAQNGHFQNKSVAKLKFDQHLQKEFGLPVYTARNKRVRISFLKIDSKGIMILTSSAVYNDTVYDDTVKFIRDRKDEIYNQIEQIKNGDLEYLKRQSEVKEGLEKLNKNKVEEDEKDGDRVK